MGSLLFNDYILYGYLDRGKQNIENPKRTLSGEEFAQFDELRKRNKDLNILITEILTILNVLQEINEPMLYYISTNMRRIVQSLKKQRDFGAALRATILTTIPTKEEAPCIGIFLKKTADRLNYLRKVVIPENLLLTPIQEYLDILDEKDFTEDIYRRFGNRTAMYQANTHENDEIQQYAKDILDTVYKNGMDEKYQTRLQEYVQQEEKRIADKKSTQKAEKLERDISLARDGMDAFQRMFNKGIRTLKGCSQIRMGPQSVESKLNEFGRDVYLVLCCYIFQNQAKYKYLGTNGELVSTFRSAKVFQDGFEAADEMAELEKKYQNRVFDVVKLDPSYEEIA